MPNPPASPVGPEWSRVLGRILTAIMELYNSRYWPEFEFLIWTAIKAYRAEIWPDVRFPDEEESETHEQT